MVSHTEQPISVHLRQDQLEALQALTAKRGVSLDELIQQGVDAVLQVEMAAESGTEARASSLQHIVGLFQSGVGDLSINHDKYLAETIEAESQQWPQKSS
jgi:hypothetical protein